MRIEWTVDPSDCEAVQQFVEKHKDNTFVLDRIRYNVTGPAPQFSRQKFWKALVGCLLTTQQRAGPGSAVVRFLSADPFPLNLSVCLANRSEGDFLAPIRGAGGIRRGPTIARQLLQNLNFLEDGGWSEVEQEARRLSTQRGRQPVDSDADLEGEAAALLARSLKGIGPKLSRDLWQDFGLTRYETPLDSRITKWLKKMWPRIPLSAGPLADPGYYNFVMDTVQALCKRANVLPCVLDAAIFASYDRDWDPEELAALRKTGSKAGGQPATQSG